MSRHTQGLVTDGLVWDGSSILTCHQHQNEYIRTIESAVKRPRAGTGAGVTVTNMAYPPVLEETSHA